MYTRDFVGPRNRIVAGDIPTPAAPDNRCDAGLPQVGINLAEQEDVVILPLRIGPSRQAHHRHCKNREDCKDSEDCDKNRADCKDREDCLDQETASGWQGLLGPGNSGRATSA